MSSDLEAEALDMVGEACDLGEAGVALVEVCETIEVTEVTETIETTEITQVDEASEPSDIAEFTDDAEVSETPDVSEAAEEVEAIELSFIQKLLKSRLVLLGGAAGSIILVLGGLSVAGVLPQIGMPKFESKAKPEGDPLTRTLAAMDAEQLSREFPEYAALPEYSGGYDKAPKLIDEEPVTETDFVAETAAVETSVVAPAAPEPPFAILEPLGPHTEYFIQPLSMQIAEGDEVRTMVISLGIKTTQSSAQKMLTQTDTVRTQLFDTVANLDLERDPKFSLPGTISETLSARLSAEMPDLVIHGVYLREFDVS